MTPRNGQTRMRARGTEAIAILVALLLLPIAAAIGPLPATPLGPWRTEPVDEPCWQNYANDVAVGRDGWVHVFHQGCMETTELGTVSQPTYSRKGLGPWQSYELPFIGDDPRIVVDDGGDVHVAFSEFYGTAEATARRVRYGSWNGSEFDTEIAYSSGSFIFAITLDGQGRPSIYHESADGPRVTTRTGPGAWSSTRLMDNNNEIEGDMAVGPDGRLRALFWGGTWGSEAAGITYFEQQSNGSWTREPAALGCFAEPHIAVDSQNNAHVSCEFNGPQGYGLYYAKRVSGTWTLEFVSGLNPNHNDIAIDSNDQPHIAYSVLMFHNDANTAPIRYTTRVNGVWLSDTIVSEATSAIHVSLALDGSGIPAIVLQRTTARGMGTLPCTETYCPGTSQTVLARPAVALPPLK